MTTGAEEVVVVDALARREAVVRLVARGAGVVTRTADRRVEEKPAPQLDERITPTRCRRAWRCGADPCGRRHEERGERGGECDEQREPTRATGP